MRELEVTNATCDLCQEIRLGGTAVTGIGMSDRPGEEGYSRLIRRTSVVDVLAGLGAVIPGYLLLLPRRHLRSLGELSLLEIQHVFDDAWTMAKRVTRIFGGSVVLVEHGSSGQNNGPSGACIEHAHIHILPLDSGIDPSRFVLPDSTSLDNLADLGVLAKKHQNYYYCAWSRTDAYLAVEPKLISQQARRTWAEAVGRKDEWDWALFPFLANVRLTATKLRRDQLSLEEAAPYWRDAELAETMNAYNAAASWYASRTKDFPKNTSLCAEMEWLVKHTEGRILDAGAGGGRDAGYFARLGRSVIALDASPALLAHVPPLENVSSIVGDVREIPLEDDYVGAIWCSAVLLHLGRDDALRALREFSRVLRPTGLAQISVKEGSGYASSPMAGRHDLRRHFFFYEGDDLKQLARLAGFDVIRTWTEEEEDSAATVQRWVKVLLRKPE